MLIEISVMQKLNIFLGHPIYGLAVVLFALLVAGGAGSFLSSRIGRNNFDRDHRICLLALLGVVTLVGLVLPRLVTHFEACSTALRISLASMLIFPPGLMMGMAFPLGIRRVAHRSTAAVPWLWGINGATSVLASVLGTALALSLGILFVFWMGALCYLTAFLTTAGSKRALSGG